MFSNRKITEKRRTLLVKYFELSDIAKDGNIFFSLKLLFFLWMADKMLSAESHISLYLVTEQLSKALCSSEKVMKFHFLK